jgi:polyphenol oxidase
MYTSELLKKQSGITHGISGVGDGNISFRLGPHDAVLACRTKFLGALGIPLDRSVSQHGMGDRILVAGSEHLGRGMRDSETSVEANAFITNQPNIGFFLPIADYLPITIFDPVQKVIALVHASRPATNLQIAAKVIAKLKSEFNCKPAGLLVAFGPTIQAKSYIFNNHIYDLVTKDWQPFLKILEPGRIAVDVPAYNRAQLIQAGVPAANIEDPGIDTTSSPNYFSHVRSTKTGEPEGRFAAAVMLR